MQALLALQLARALRRPVGRGRAYEGRADEKQELGIGFVILEMPPITIPEEHDYNGDSEG